jgi:hypothetical protein
MEPRTDIRQQLTVELEEIRRRGLHRLDGVGTLPALNTFPLIEGVATARAAAETWDCPSRWHAVERLLAEAVGRLEAESVRERLRRLYGLTGELRWGLPGDLMDSLKRAEGHQHHQRTFQRRNAEARSGLADVICSMVVTDDGQPAVLSVAAPAALPAAQPAALSAASSAGQGRRFWAGISLLAVLRAMALLLGAGIGTTLGIGLASGYGLAPGAIVVCAGFGVGWRSPAVPYYAGGTALSGLLFAFMAAGWPTDNTDGLLCGFLVGTVLGRVAMSRRKLVRQVDQGDTRAVWLIAALTSIFWLGVGTAALRQAGNGGPASSIVWTAITAPLILCGLADSFPRGHGLLRNHRGHRGVS